MYEKYYGFSEEPFNLNLDPRFFFLTKNFEEAWNSLIYGITNRKGFLLVTGEEGVGKTTLIGLIHLYFAITNPKIRIIPIFRPCFNLEEYIEEILRKLRFPVFRGTKSSMVLQFNNFLRQGSSKGEILAIMFDESQNLSNETLEDLRLLANRNTKSGTFVQEIFVGEPHIERKLESRDLRPLRQRMTIQVDLKPLTKEESRQYMEHRLNKAGSNISKVFTPKAENLIFRYSQGNPMIMNRICDKAFSFGYSQMKKTIDCASVKEAIAKLEKERSDGARLGGKTSSRRRRHSRSDTFSKVFLFSSLAFACLGLALFVGGTNWKFRPGEKLIQTTSSWFTMGKNYFLDLAIPHFKAIWPWADDDSFPPLSEGGKVEIVQPGDSVFSLAKEFYGADNLTIIDYILQENPGVVNPQKIQVKQKITLPAITENAPVLKYSGGIYKIWLGTFLTLKETKYLKNDPALKGGEIEVIPQKSPAGATWYRVVWGEFHSVKEFSGILKSLKEKGKLPIFEGLKDKEKISEDKK
jgi:general secretion pathway protein A